MVAIPIRAIGGLDAQVCGLDRCRGGLGMRDKAEDRVRCDSDDGTEAQRGSVMGPPSRSQLIRE